MKIKLTATDRKNISNYIRIPLVILIFFFLIAGITMTLFFYNDGDFKTKGYLIGNLISLGFFSLLFLLISRKHFKDLKIGEKEVVVQEVQQKFDKTSYEAGSGTLYIPILGDLFPKLWGREKREPNYLTYLVIDYTRYMVSKELFDSVQEGDKIEMHFTLTSKNLLLIKKA